MGMPIVANYFPPDAGDKIVGEAEEMLHDMVGVYIPDDIDVNYLVAQGSIYRRILRMAEKINADLIVMPAHRLKLQDYLLGTNTAKVVRHAQCSVLVVRYDLKNPARSSISRATRKTRTKRVRPAFQPRPE